MKSTRHRPTKSDEIDIFSGLLFCAGCGYKTHTQNATNVEVRKHAD